MSALARSRLDQSSVGRRRVPALSARKIAEVSLAPAVGLLVAAVLIAASGFQAIPTIMAGLDYALGSVVGVARALAWALPLYIATVGVTLAFRTGVFTLGAEGQIYAGALTGALVGAFVGGLAPLLHQVLCVLAAAFVAGALSMGLGWLATAWRVDVILSSLLSNYVLVLACLFLASGPFNDPAAEAPGATVQVLPSARVANLVPRTQLTWAVVGVVLLCVAAWWVAERSTSGYRARMVGMTPGFAHAVGIDVARTRVLAMAGSGAFCGMAGALIVIASQGRFTSEIAIGIGWTAVMLALVSRARPALAVVWVSVYAVMQAASRRIEQVAEVPSELALLVISTILVTAAAAPGLVALITSWSGRRRGVV